MSICREFPCPAQCVLGLQLSWGDAFDVLGCTSVLVWSTGRIYCDEHFARWTHFQQLSWWWERFALHRIQSGQWLVVRRCCSSCICIFPTNRIIIRTVQRNFLSLHWTTSVFILVSQERFEQLSFKFPLCSLFWDYK